MFPKFTPEKTLNISSEFDNQAQNHRALLSSNETVPQNFFKEMDRRPDGSLVGVGLGMSLGMLEAFENGPQNIVLFDINQHVVASGRIFIEMLKQSDNFQDFETNLKNQDLVESLYNKVTQDEPLLKDQNANFYDLTQFIHDQFFNFTKNKNPQIHRSVKEKFTQIKTLAETNKFNIFLGDLGSEEWTEGLSSHINADPGTHLIYLSNTPDYICVDQSRTRKFNKNLDKIGSSLSKPPVWIDTLHISKDVLKSHSSPPNFRSQIGNEHSYSSSPVRGMVDYLERHSLESEVVMQGREVTIMNKVSDRPENIDVVIPSESGLGPSNNWHIHIYRGDDEIRFNIGTSGEELYDTPGNREYLANFLGPTPPPHEFDYCDDLFIVGHIKPEEPMLFFLPNGQKISVQSTGENPKENKFIIKKIAS